MIRQVPISMSIEDKREVRSQFAALCYQHTKKGNLKLLLVTTRNTGRWILPKGWPIAGKTPGETALVEAWEEAGIKGDVHEQCLGIFSYQKSIEEGKDVPAMAMVYAVKMTSHKAKFPEAGERKVKWFTPKKAAALVDELELKEILLNFDPNVL